MYVNFYSNGFLYLLQNSDKHISLEFLKPIVNNGKFKFDVGVNAISLEVDPSRYIEQKYK